MNTLAKESTAIEGADSTSGLFSTGAGSGRRKVVPREEKISPSFSKAIARAPVGEMDKHGPVAPWARRSGSPNFPAWVEAK